MHVLLDMVLLLRLLLLMARLSLLRTKDLLGLESVELIGKMWCDRWLGDRIPGSMIYRCRRIELLDKLGRLRLRGMVRLLDLLLLLLLRLLTLLALERLLLRPGLGDLGRENRRLDSGPRTQWRAVSLLSGPHISDDISQEHGRVVAVADVTYKGDCRLQAL